jgi:sugar phosphate isomerase/epimerase
MKLGSITTNLLNLQPDAGIALLRELDVDCVEIACGGFFTDRSYGDIKSLVEDAEVRERWLERWKQAHIEISAIAVHGEPLSPDREVAERYRRDFEYACRLAQLIGTERLTLLVGLPEANPGDPHPTWIVVADPEANSSRWEWQWEHRVLPYWRRMAAFAADHGCRLCFEMAPSDFGHSPRALLMLREALGPVIGCNFDPSHLWWQGIDPLAALRALDGAIYHAHAKDTEITPEARVNGLLDARASAEPSVRAWNFRTAGAAHDEQFWRSYIETLRAVGYDDVLSIEHEDARLSGEQGLRDAVAFLRPLLADPA